jgi:NADH-quinone oxidoreductase subunit N
MQNYLAVIAGATMIVGNVVALFQKNIKRMFAYSSISHAGYILVALTSMNYFMFDTIWFYLAAYLFMNLGAFAIIQLMAEKTGSEEIADYAGLYKRSPVLAVSMGILILSLAGFPGTAGFIGKINIFMGAFVDPSAHYVLGSVMIATTVVSYVYYFGVLKQIFLRPSRDESKLGNIPFGILFVVFVAVIGSLWLGIVPNTALDFLHNHFNQFQDFLR